MLPLAVPSVPAASAFLVDAINMARMSFARDTATCGVAKSTYKVTPVWCQDGSPQICFVTKRNVLVNLCEVNVQGPSYHLQFA